MARIDGRKPDEMRQMVCKAGVIPNANGSAYFGFGKTRALAAVYGPRTVFPKFKTLSSRALLQTTYAMAPFSTTERVNPGPSRRSQEISLVTRHALEPALFLDEFPKSAIDVFIMIVSAEAGTRTAGINAASVALADAGMPMKDLVSAVAAGKIGDEYMLDLVGEEEDHTDCDLPIAMMPRTGKFTLMQLDGDLPKEDIKKVVMLAKAGCEKVYEIQKKALLERWGKK